MAPEGRALRGLYAITPETADTAGLLARVEAALAGGAAAIQYRAKALAPGAARAQAEAILALTRRRGVPLIVNDSLEMARDIGADGLHLGRDDADVALARRRFPGLIGVSCYDEVARARAAAAAGADYVAIGSVFASATKPGAVRAPLERIGEAAAASGLPVVAIGGITPANAPSAIAAGAAMVAVISAVFDAPDVRAAARAFADLFDSPPSGAPDVRAQPRPL